MIEVHPEPGKDYLVFKASGVIQSKDYVESMGKFEQLIAATQPKAVLIDWTDLTHWREETEGLRLFARAQHRSTFERVAVIDSGAWDAEFNRLQELMHCSVKRFSPSERQFAEDWLQAAE